MQLSGNCARRLLLPMPSRVVLAKANATPLTQGKTAFARTKPLKSSSRARVSRIESSQRHSVATITMAPAQEKEIKTVLMIIAMEAEAAPLVEELGLKKDEPSKIPGPATCVTFSGNHGDLNVHIVCNGVCKEHGVDNVGTVPATLTSYLGIQTFKPDLVISAGTAGGFKAKGAEIGDVYHSTHTINHDRLIEIPVFTAYGMDLRPATPCPNMVKALGLKEGVVSTGNRFNKLDEDMKTMAENDAAVKEMEAAAIAWACSLSETPFFALKSVTDIVDGDKPSGEEFMENLHKAAAHLKDAVVGSVAFLEGKKLGDL